MKEDTIKYRHALVVDTEKVIDIKEVNEENRHQCHLCCPYCKGAMIPVLPRERAAHFRHRIEPDLDRCSPDNVLHSLAQRVFYEEYNKCLNDGTPFIISAKLPIKCNNACVLKRHTDCYEHYIRQEIDLTKFFKKEPKLEATLKSGGLNGRTIWRPDILLETEGGEQLWVEIWVHHASSDEKKKEGSVLEIKIQSEDDLDQFYHHRIEESRNGDDKVTITNKNLFERIGFICDESVSKRQLPCEHYYTYEYYPNEQKGKGVESFSKKDANNGQYLVVARLNWYESYNYSGSVLSKHDDSELEDAFYKRALSILRGDKDLPKSIFSPLIVYENKDIKIQSHLDNERYKKTVPHNERILAPERQITFIEPDLKMPEDNNESVLSILKGLNAQQRIAVQTIIGPLLIVAGAGSGKTKVLTSRVAYILAKGEDPARVLALTFTKKAAEEMKERIALLVGKRMARGLVMGTFHSVFIRFLRDYATSIGYPGNFTIYDRSDSESAIKHCVKQLGLDEKIYKPREVLSRISFAKNGLFTPEAYCRNQEMRTADLHSKKPKIGEIYTLYQQTLKQNGVMDFDDILLNMNILLRDNETALREISSRFDYIMVDEYQDTNYSQYLILKKLSRPHHNLCVVGDDSQSIYAFRGAQIQNILNFRKDYPESEIIRLERNYRSTRNIVDAANSVIAHNEGRIPKTCYSEGEAGEKIELLKAFTEQEEAVLIVSEIVSRVMREKAQYQDFAILYRTNSQSRALEEQLRRKNIPYMIYSGNSFFDRAEIKDMMAWFKLCVNVNDDESFRRAVGKPSRGIGDTSLSALNEVARAHRCSLFAATSCEDYLEYGLRPAAMQKIRAFRDLVNKLAVAAASGDAFEVARTIYDDSGLYALYKSDTSIEGIARTSNLDELLNSVQAFKEERLDDILADLDAEQPVPPMEHFSASRTELPVPDEGEMLPISITLADFLETTSLLSNADTADDDENGSNKVALMTVHSAKGLEFPYVFVAGAEENLFPSGGMMASPADVEEERRLFYVALTRAKKAVYVSFASTRMRNGKHESNSPSRFVKEIDPKYVANPLPEGGIDDAGEDDDDTPFWFHRSTESGFSSRAGGRYGGFSVKATGSSRSGSAFSPRNYGQSGAVRYEKRTPAATGKGPVFGAHGPQSTGIARPLKPTATPDIIDPNFVAVPMTELYEGERVEHNRFGAGLIKEITGTVPELKAVIDFDKYGSKVLLLKYAKLRPL